MGWLYSRHCPLALILLHKPRAPDPSQVSISVFGEIHNAKILSYFWTTLSSITIVTSLLAFAIFHLDGVNGLQGWR
jgi:hypothetical protein